MNPTLPSDLLQYLKTRALPKRLLRVGLALTSTFYSLRPDSLLAKSSPRAGTPERDWPIEGGLTPLTLPERLTPSRGELFFIDAGVADPGAFWLAAPKGGTVVCIPAGVDSWHFMAQEAARFQGLRAIHIVSHGQPGAVVLNGQHYAAADLETLTIPLQQLGRALTKNGDIFLYGCEVGAGVAGQTLLNTLAAATGADIAASKDNTGNAPHGGNWDLEIVTGQIDSSLALNATSMAGYDAVLATFTVTTTADTGTGSLRQAITDANATAANDIIDFSFGSGGSPYTIVLATALPSIAATSSAGTLTIKGLGASSLTISGDNGDASRNFNVINISSGGNLGISGVTISGARTNAGGGGGISNSGTLALSNSTISNNNVANGWHGGGIFNNGSGTLILSNSTISNNNAGYFGGGIFNQGIASVSNSTFSANYGQYGGAIANQGTLTISNSTIASNSAKFGAGSYNQGSLTVKNCTISSNSAAAGGGGGGFRGGATNISNSIIANNLQGDLTGDVTGIYLNNIVGSLSLDSLQNNGGPTSTMAIAVGSSANGSGNASASNTAPVFSLDQRGYTRSSTAPSIGAYEYNGTIPLAPTVTSVSPSTGSLAGGNSITITGTNVAGATSVTIGGAPTNFTVASATSITAITPAGSAGSASLIVTTIGGSNATNTLFTYSPAPTVTSISPTSGSQAGGTTITITGANFTGATAIALGGTAATNVTVVSSTSITATTPAGSAGAASALVTTPSGTNATNTLFTYLNVSAANNPTFGTPTSTADGFTVQISNYDNTFTYGGTATASGTVSISGNGLVTVSGVAANTSSTATITTTRTGYESGSAQVTATTQAAPGVPTAVSAVRGNAQATVTFTAPASNGGAAITGYTVTSSPAGGTDSNAGSTSLSHVITGLTNGTSYTFTVTATNSVGTGSASSASAAVTPATTPTVTSPTSASVGNTSATLGGDVTATGGASLTAVGVVYSATSANNNPQLSGTGVTNLPGTAATGVFTVSATGLTAGTAYSYAAYATNSVGTTYSSVGTFTTTVPTPTLTFTTPSTASVVVGATQTNAVTSTLSGGSYGGVTYTSSETSKATVNATTGVVTGLAVGTTTITATQAASSGFNATTSTTYTLTVTIGTPTITAVPTATGITYGQTLASSTLSGGTASVAGTFTFTTTSTAPSAGTAAQGVTFTPTDTTNYTSTTTTANVAVAKATPTLTWATPSTITYGTTLSATQLNATSSLAAGTIVYSPASGTTPSAGTQTLTATFTPTDTANYNTATGTVSLTVNKATPTITWATPSTISYGTALSATQLNATSSLAAGAITYSPASGSTPSAGTQTLTATFTPTDTANYNTATGTVSLVVGKATPTLTWATPSAITYGTTLSATQLNATSSLAAGTITYSPASGATPSAGTQTLTATFTPTDTANYNTATGTVYLTVNKATPTVTWTTPSTISYGTALSATQLNATSSLAAGAITYSPASGTTPSAGTQTLTATFTPTDTTNYNTATGTVSLTVNKATPTITWATPSAITYGTALSATQLNATISLAAGTIVYSPASGTTPSAGTQTLTATFTPTDTANYNTATGTVSLTVNKATPTITWATPSTISYGTALSATQLNATANVAGAITYSPASGSIPSIGTQTLTATFTPADTTNYNPASASVALSVAVAVPGSPTALAATTANGEATITFTAPGNPGSSAITGYTIRATATDGSTVTVNATGSPAKVTGLTPGKSYRFTVTANNSAGSSESNTTSDALTISLVNQTITFAPLADRTSNSGSFALTASASSGLPVTFTVVSGPALLAGNVVDLTGAIGTVLIRASQAGNATYAAAPNGEVSFVVTAGATQAIFSKVESASSKTSEADLAVVLTVNSRDGTLLMVSSSTPSLNGAADFTVGSGGAFSASIVSTTGTNNVDSLGRRVLSAPVTYKITGTLVDNVLTGTISPLGYSFKSNVTPPSAGSSSPVGFYKSTALAEGAGVTYSLVGPNNEVLVLAISPTATVGGLTTLKSDGTYSIAATTSAGNVTLSGGVNPTTTATTATLTLPGNIKVDFSGLSTTTKRTDRLIGLASRAKVGTGESVLITGLAIGGTESKRVLIRAGGPALAAFGLASTLPNPTLKIYRDATLIAQNDDWNPADAAEMGRLGIFAFPNGSKDAAILTTLEPGSYTAHVSDLSGTGTGVALAEIYDASVNPTADYQRLVSIASRGTVSVGDGALIGGFVVVGNSPKTLLIRGIGPALTRFGLVGALADPVLTIYDGGEAIATNAGWANSAAIATAATQAGAFALTTDSRDAALLVTLKPGSYTAQVKATQVTSSGVALIEIYEVP